MNKRENLLALLDPSATADHVPAAFFIHFDEAHHQGQAAIDKHLEYFRHTDMDFVKIQYEQKQPTTFRVARVEDWANAPLYPAAYFEPTLNNVKGLLQAAQSKAMVILTVYSPFMWAKLLLQETDGDINKQFLENPQAVAKGVEIMTQNVLTLVRACKAAGIDGFYVSTQGGEAFRFPGTDIFEKYIKPTDLAVWDEIQDCDFNILHVCDYDGGYADLTPFLDYPGHVVNCSLDVGGQMLTPTQAGELFGRPYMGGLERKGVLAHGDTAAIRAAATEVLQAAPTKFILAADCTVPAETSWDNLKTAIDTAHSFLC